MNGHLLKTLPRLDFTANLLEIAPVIITTDYKLHFLYVYLEYVRKIVKDGFEKSGRNTLFEEGVFFDSAAYHFWVFADSHRRYNQPVELWIGLGRQPYGY